MKAQQLQQALAGQRIKTALVTEYAGEIWTIILQLDNGRVVEMRAESPAHWSMDDPHIAAIISK